VRKQFVPAKAKILSFITETLESLHGHLAKLQDRASSKTMYIPLYEERNTALPKSERRYKLKRQHYRRIVLKVVRLLHEASKLKEARDQINGR
jgi:hypothetical protein